MAKKQKTCSCCGGDAGKFEQWHNRDAGYGVCRKCADWILGLGETPEQFHRCYGVAGIHYEPKMFRLYSRDFIVLAEFPNTDAGTKDANDYMLAHDGACLLDEGFDILTIAHCDDDGIPVMLH